MADSVEKVAICLWFEIFRRIEVVSNILAGGIAKSELSRR